jgi:hypothetical protein
LSEFLSLCAVCPNIYLFFILSEFFSLCSVCPNFITLFSFVRIFLYFVQFVRIYFSRCSVCPNFSLFIQFVRIFLSFFYPSLTQFSNLVLANDAQTFFKMNFYQTFITKQNKALQYSIRLLSLFCCQLSRTKIFRRKGISPRK